MRLISLAAVYFCCLIPNVGLSQQASRFTLVVNVNVEAGDTIYAGESYFLKQYKSAKFFKDSINADRSKFIFTGELLYPTAIRLFSLSDKPKFNQLVFIDSGYQEINLQKQDSTILISQLPSTKISKEYQEFLNYTGVVDLDSKIPETKMDEYVKNNRVLTLPYIVSFPKPSTMSFLPGFSALRPVSTH